MTQAQERINGQHAPSEHEQLTDLLSEISTGVTALGDALSAIEMGLTALAEKLGSSSERVSSVEVKTSARGEDVAVKCYTGSDVQPAGSAAIAEYFAALETIKQEKTLRATRDAHDAA